MSGDIKACISLLEDDRIQVATIEEAIKLSLPKCLFRIATNGKELLRLLSLEPPPNVLILDINTPVLSGWDVLKAVRARSDLDWMPVVMFSTDDSVTTRLKAKELRATAMVSKPVGLNSTELMGKALVEIVQTYAVPDSVVAPILKPLLQESVPFIGERRSLDDLLDDL